MTLIVPLTKNPNPKGRIGDECEQDWYRGCFEAVLLEKQNRDSTIVVVSNVTDNDFSEPDKYAETLQKMGARSITMVREAFETVRQIEVIERIERIVQEEGFIIVSTWTHYLRVRWLCRGKGWRHVVVGGIPRPREIVTDAILTFAYPLIELLGGRDWYLSWVEGRRGQGKW